MGDDNWLVWFIKTFIELICVLCLVVYRVLESWIRFFYSPRKDLCNEIVVLTGAAGGFGTLIAEKMIKKGCIMILLDLNIETVQTLADTLNKSQNKNKAYAYQCDVTNREEIKTVGDQIVQNIGHPTMLINNAGIVAGRYFQDLEQEDVLKTFNVNILSHYLMVKAFLPHMLEQNHGHVISVASILGIYSLAGVSEYGPSKAAAVSFMTSLRQEIRLLGKDGVHCTTILPYQVNTELFKGCAIRFKTFPILNVLCPDYVADKIVDAIEKNKITIYIPRSCYFLGVLLQILPDRGSDALFDFLKSNEAMKRFVGRTKKDT